MKNRLITALVLGCASPALALPSGSELYSQLSETVKNMVSVDAEVASRISHLEDGDTTNIVNAELGVNIHLIKDKCLVLKTTTTLSPEDEDNFYGADLYTGILDGERSDLDIKLRHIYVDSKCLMNKALQISAGAMPIQSKGSLGIDNDGFMDAVRMAYKTNLKSLSKVAITVGQLDPEADVSPFSRDYDDTNFKQVTLYGAAGIVNYAAEITKLNDDTFYRVMASVAINNIAYLDKVGVEVLHDDNDIIGKEVRVMFKKVNNVQLAAGWRDLESNSLPQDEKILRDRAVFASAFYQREGSKCGVGLDVQQGKEEGYRADLEYRCKWN